MTLRFGRVGGLLLVGAALAAVPSTLLLHPRPPLTAYLIVLAAVVAGLVCAVAPWDRVGQGWLNLPAALAIGLVALAARYVDISYELYYMLIAVYTAYVFPRWRVLRWHLGLIAFALLLPLAGGSAMTSETLRQMLLVLPSVVIVGGVVAYLRQRLDEKERLYRGFAAEALVLAGRISQWTNAPAPAPTRPAAGAPAAEGVGRRRSSEGLWPRWKAPRIRRPVVAIALIGAGLVVAAVSIASVAGGPQESGGPTRAPIVVAPGASMANQVGSGAPQQLAGAALGRGTPAGAGGRSAAAVTTAASSRGSRSSAFSRNGFPPASAGAGPEAGGTTIAAGAISPTKPSAASGPPVAATAPHGSGGGSSGGLTGDLGRILHLPQPPGGPSLGGGLPNPLPPAPNSPAPASGG